MLRTVCIRNSCGVLFVSIVVAFCIIFMPLEHRLHRRVMSVGCSYSLSSYGMWCGRAPGVSVSTGDGCGLSCTGIGSGALTCSGSRAGGSGSWLMSVGGSSIVVVLAAPEMSACRCWIAVSLSFSAFCLLSIAIFNCCVALTMQSVSDITGVARCGVRILMCLSI